jgi:hypothetical protein
MLHDGENHEVWRPGMRRTRKVDSQVCNKYRLRIHVAYNIVQSGYSYGLAILNGTHQSSYIV